MIEEPYVWILDASAIIAIKRILPRNRWQRIYQSRLPGLVKIGRVAFPKKIVEELGRYHEQDNIYEFASRSISLVLYETEPSFELVREVMVRAGNVVDPTKQHEDADPYVLAQALDIQRAGMSVTVVTEDRGRKVPPQISMAAACETLGIAWCRTAEFLDSNNW